MNAAVESSTETRFESVLEVARRYRRHPSSIIRSILQGARVPGTTERIKIAGAIRTPKSWLIPVGAIEAFYAQLTAARLATTAAPPSSASIVRQRQLANVEAELAARGYPPSK
jgi:hypothetical protein